MIKIYALLDFELNQKQNRSIEEFIDLAYKKSAIYLQYRDKINPHDIKLKNLKLIRKLWKKTLIINDDIELAKYCDGLHVGQEDLAKIDIDKKKAIKIIRDKIGRKILGISTHNLLEIKEANLLDIDYIGLGAYRGTKTKNVTNILGKELEKLAKYSTKPVAAIGGVRVDDKIKNVSFLVIGTNIYY